MFLYIRSSTYNKERCFCSCNISSLCTQSVSVSLLCEGGFGFPVDQEHPLPPLMVGSSLDRARLALEQVSEVSMHLGRFINFAR